MLGDDEEDLRELVEACSNQVERPDIRDRDAVSRQQPPVASTSAGGAGGIDPTVKALLEQNNQLMEMVRQAKDGESSKRKERQEVSHSPEEPIMLFDEAYHLEDDGHEKLDLKLRQRLRQINADPTTYWIKGAFKTVDRPIRGAALYMEHLMPNHINEKTICMHYDRCAIQEIKNYLTKNSGVMRKLDKKLKVDRQDDEYSMGIQTSWLDASDVFEVVDAGWNYLSLEFMVRGYSYAGIAIMRCLHEVRFFAGVATGAKQQRTLIECYFNECFKVHDFVGFRFFCIWGPLGFSSNAGG